MATTFKVWAVNLVPLGTAGLASDDGLPLTWDQATLDAFLKDLKDLFDEVCKGSAFASSDVAVTPVSALATTVKPGDLAVRLTRKRDSLVLRKAGGLSSEPSGATLDITDSGGTSQGVLSEIWVEKAGGEPDKGSFLANLAFHELMHNKLDAAASSTRTIHDKPPAGLDGEGLAAGTFSATTALSPSNKRNMRAKLAAKVAQFTGAALPP
jgi:hypothetical protein